MKSIELFSGAGGLAMGLSLAGFKHKAVIEWDKDACDSMLYNKAIGVHPLADWPIYRADVRGFNFSEHENKIDLLGGGPPCQPFSLGGKHRAFKDERDMFPTTIQIIGDILPKAFVLENVKGLLRQSFFNYFEYILLHLSFPYLKRKQKETWITHHSRLEQHKNSGGAPQYNVVCQLLNAADYGVPQKRERVFIVGFREDLEIPWSFNKDVSPSHSLESLIWDKWVSGEYWERHNISRKERPELPDDVAPKIKMLKDKGVKPGTKPWRTVRDAIADLPDPETNFKAIPNHIHNPGARIYPGHTGSPMDEPSKTLKAGDHGVPGGENMILFPNGKVRYFTVRESARLQTFPDKYVFSGSWTESMRQLGNAVPVDLAFAVGKGIRKYL